MNRSTSLNLFCQSIDWQQLPRYLLRTPVGRLWTTSGLIWLWLLTDSLLLQDAHQHHLETMTAIQSISTQVKHWVMMLIAMMFPLLALQVNHIVFAMPGFRRFRSILIYLFGYSLLWLLFLAAVLGLQAIAASLSIDTSIYPLLGVGCFILVTILIWSKNHPVIMASCSATMSLGIMGWRADIDCVKYGLKTAKNCIRSCWLPMLALILTNHAIGLMFLVTLALWYERYFLSHISKQMSIIWMLLACLSVVMI
ncbi:MAG: DUF2182 domain-containing protein [Algicola sp.]|nr:DUF2182 domain-containing protein [Algicola sp.]